jgi:Fe2+ or Zn2+ uptake regulation protein
MDTALTTLTTTLKSNSYSLTKARKTVFLALIDKEPQTMAELVKAVGGKIDRASIYRVIALFEKLGIVERIQIGWKYKLELSDVFRSHHHHITCVKCGRTQMFEESKLIEFELKQLAEEAGFTETGHQLELRGICTNCQ